jgi:hypothetical protein
MAGCGRIEQLRADFDDVGKVKGIAGRVLMAAFAPFSPKAEIPFTNSISDIGVDEANRPSVRDPLE